MIRILLAALALTAAAPAPVPVDYRGIRLGSTVAELPPGLGATCAPPVDGVEVCQLPMSQSLDSAAMVQMTYWGTGGQPRRLAAISLFGYPIWRQEAMNGLIGRWRPYKETSPRRLEWKPPGTTIVLYVNQDGVSIDYRDTALTARMEAAAQAKAATRF